MKNVFIVGAGRLGKGFVAETFDNAGWKITFLDKDSKVAEELEKQGCFHVKVHRVEEIQNRTITNFKAFTCDSGYSCMEAFLETDLIVLPLYPEDFKDAGHYLSKCFEKFYEVHPERKLTLICITNKNYEIPKYETYFKELLSDEAQTWFDKNVVIRDSIIRRAKDAESNYATDIDTVAVNSLLIQGPVNNDFSDVEWMEVVDKVEMLKDIKVTAVNGPHASYAFLGYLRGWKTIEEAEEDSWVAEIVEKAREEITEGVLKEYPVTPEEVHNLVYFAPAKGVLPDSIHRVAFDPVRKVSKGDRLTGAAYVNWKHGVPFDNIAIGLAAGFGYADPDDENAQIIQKDIKTLGIKKTISKYIDFPEDHIITETVLKQYNMLCEQGLIK